MDNVLKNILNSNVLMDRNYKLESAYLTILYVLMDRNHKMESVYLILQAIFIA